MQELSLSGLRDWPLPSPDGASDKEDRGRVLVIAGSREIPGAALLAATAALRAGAGKLVVATAGSVAAAIAIALPEARVIALPETGTGGFAPEGAALLQDACTRTSAALIGPGFANARDSTGFVTALLRQLEGAGVVLDAAAMDAVLERPPFRQRLLLTPHAGEMAHLTGKSKEDVVAHGLQLARDMAARIPAVVALKGSTTFVVSPDGACWQHTASLPGLGTSGSGDVLAGLMVGLAARGATLEQAAAWGVTLHAEAGKRLCERIGPLGFLARELLVEIPLVMRD